MYSKQDVLDADRQYRRAVLLWLIPETLLLLGVAVSFVYRIEWLTILLSFLLGAALVFSLNLYVLPVRRYREYLNMALTGKTRRSVAAFKSFSDQIAVREGVRFYPVIMHVGNPRFEMDERQFFWDINLPRPEWKEGDKIALLSHEKLIVGWQAAPGEPLAG